MYDCDECTCEEASWIIERQHGSDTMFFEAHLTDDEYSPNGWGWYFASYIKTARGAWEEYDGGCYWDYRNAGELEGIIGETIPYKEFEVTRCDHSLFDEVVFGGESLSERAARTTECSYGRLHETQDIARGR